MPDVRLAPDAVRAQLFESLAPVMRLAERFAASGACDARALRYVVELHPLRLQVAIAQDEGRPARRLTVVEGRRLPDRGRAVGAAVEALAGVILASLPEETATAAVLNAGALEDGGFFVMADPTDKTAILALAGPGGSLGEGIYVGALADAPETVH